MFQCYNRQSSVKSVCIEKGFFNERCYDNIDMARGKNCLEHADNHDLYKPYSKCKSQNCMALFTLIELRPPDTEFLFVS